MPRPLRTSCDRCHSSKLKCPKQPGTDICTRCMKAGAECVFSPAGAGTRRMMMMQQATPIYENDFSFATPLVNDMGIQFDWIAQTPSLPTCLTLNPELNTPPELSTTLGQAEEQHQQQTEPDSRDLPVEDCSSACGRQLSSLAVDINQVHSYIPSCPLIHANKDRPIVEFTAEFLDKYMRQQALENLFTTAQRLIDIYPRALRFIFQQPEDDGDDNDCQDPDCIHLEDVPVDLRGVLAADAFKTVPIDTFLFNLLVTCHSRLLQTLERLLTHVKACAKVTLATKDDSNPPWTATLPKLTLGSFTPSPKASSTMQAVLIVHVASVLAEQAKGLDERLTVVTEAIASEKKIKMLKMQCQVLVEEAETKARELRAVQDRLTRMEFKT